MSSGKMLFGIVNKGDAGKLMDALRSAGARGGTVLNAHGTAPSSIMSMLGLGDSKKEILLSMLSDDIEKDCLESLKKSKSRGVVALLGEKEENDMESKDLLMIQVICENGYADDIMAAARKEGAKGGTVLKGHGTAKEGDTQFFGYPITAEKEILVIVEEKEKAEKIISAIDKLPFLKQKGKAVVFSLPVCHFSNIG